MFLGDEPHIAYSIPSGKVTKKTVVKRAMSYCTVGEPTPLTP